MTKQLETMVTAKIGLSKFSRFTCYQRYLTVRTMASVNLKSPKHKSALGFKNPSHRYAFLKSGDMWLDDRKATSGAEGLWRIHDGLYNFTDFIEKHPGGQFWLKATRVNMMGADITEAFEAHHISSKPEMLLKKYFVRAAKVPRSSPYTFKDDGFYRTLKRNVRAEMKTFAIKQKKSSDFIADGMLVCTFVFAILSNSCWSFLLAVASGISFGLTLVASHNYTHQRDNFRMYYSDVCMMQSREWRILHILSHHLYTNTVLDAQVYFSEPFVIFYPQQKSLLLRYGSWIYTPLLLWPNLLHIGFMFRISQWIFYDRTEQLSYADLLPLTMPLAMYVIGGHSVICTLAMWLFIETVGSFTFSLVGYTTGHFHPEIYIDGDRPRDKEDRDWGIIQLDCVSDRREITGSKFLVLTTFGDHALHHLFPTLDHGLLKKLYPVVQKTMKEFNVDIWMTTHSNMFAGYFRQLARQKPNLKAPNSLERNKREF